MEKLFSLIFVIFSLCFNGLNAEVCSQDEISSFYECLTKGNQRKIEGGNSSPETAIPAPPRKEEQNLPGRKKRQGDGDDGQPGPLPIDGTNNGENLNLEDTKKKYKECFTKNNCAVPTSRMSFERASIQQNDDHKKCFNTVFEEKQKCMSDKGELFPPNPKFQHFLKRVTRYDESNSEGNNFGNGNHGNNAENSGDSKECSFPAAKKCVAGLMPKNSKNPQKSTAFQGPNQGVLKNICTIRQICLGKLSENCQVLWKKTDDAQCECSEKIRQSFQKCTGSDELMKQPTVICGNKCEEILGDNNNQ